MGLWALTVEGKREVDEKNRPSGILGVKAREISMLKSA